ncbi:MULTISPECIES: TetR/AcrR family transcriptional regulator [Streptomyces]|uniref:TetR/AcrR family transcriptional regulator n=1 Tax=Streptomyces TaxID=1883 RepID=UPI000997352A|nr:MULTISPECIES: TetR/AcrR family transcriptional regulator [Streptomyces]
MATPFPSWLPRNAHPAFSIHIVAVKSNRHTGGAAYNGVVPKLWNETIEEHRNAVREAILRTTWSLATEQGPMSVTMSQIAEKVGIGRATLYKYFPDVESILSAFHEGHIASHIEQLHQLRESLPDPGERVRAVLERYALISYRRRSQGTEELSALLHRGEAIVQAQRHLSRLFEDVIAQAAAARALRDDIAPRELAAYCLHSLTAAADLPSEAAVHRLVSLTLQGMQTPA